MEKATSKDFELESEDEVSGEISVRAAGRKGGTTTRDRYGIRFYREIGARGAETTKRRWGHLLSEFGRRGGRPRRPNLENNSGGESPEKKEVDAVGPRDSPPA